MNKIDLVFNMCLYKYNKKDNFIECDLFNYYLKKYFPEEEILRYNVLSILVTDKIRESKDYGIYLNLYDVFLIPFLSLMKTHEFSLAYELFNYSLLSLKYEYLESKERIKEIHL